MVIEPTKRCSDMSVLVTGISDMGDAEVCPYGDIFYGK